MLIGEAFDLIRGSGWPLAALTRLALMVLGAAVVQGLGGLLRNYPLEFLAQRVEREARDELYADLLGKSQTFHGRQRIGDIMARAFLTNSRILVAHRLWTVRRAHRILVIEEGRILEEGPTKA